MESLNPQRSAREDEAPVLVLDTLGLFCPVPIIETQKAMGRLSVGKVLEVLSDDVGILEDLPAWCRAFRHQYLGSTEERKGVYRCGVKKVHD